MGAPMAAHLARAEHDVTVYNRTAEKAREWVRLNGGSFAPTPAAAAANAEAVIACVGGDADVEQVTTGPDGAFHNMAEGALFIDHTTASAKLSRQVAEEGRRRGLLTVDAPVSGGQAGAESGRLAIMCGGSDAAFAAAEPLMQAYALRIVHVGPDGSGQLAKMVNQICIAGVVQGLAEAIHFAKQADLDTNKGVRGCLRRRRVELADAQPLEDDGRRRVRFRLRGRLDAQGSRLHPRRGAPQRRQPAADRLGRSILRRRAGARRQPAGYILAHTKADAMKNHPLSPCSCEAGAQMLRRLGSCFRRSTLGLALALLVATPATADTLIDNVNGYTLDGKGELVRFNGLLVGNDGRVKQLYQGRDKRIERPDFKLDGKGRALLPGLIDAHGHVMGLGLGALSLDLSDTNSLQEAQAKIAAYAAANPSPRWIQGRGWNQERWKLGRFPTAADIDAVVADRPVYLGRVDGHAGWANSLAMTEAGITADSKAPDGGRIERTGKLPSGIFVDAAMDLMEKAVPPPLPRTRDKAFASAQEILLSLGLTTVADMGTSVEDWSTIRRAGDAGRLNIRIISYAAGSIRCCPSPAPARRNGCTTTSCG